MPVDGTPPAEEPALHERRGDSPWTTPSFHVWNMGKRIANVRRQRESGHRLVDQALASASLSDRDRRRATKLLGDLDRAADDAEDLAGRLHAELAAGQPGAVEDTGQELVVLHNRGDDPELMARLWAIWRSDTSIARAQEARTALHGLLGGSS